MMIVIIIIIVVPTPHTSNNNNNKYLVSFVVFFMGRKHVDFTHARTHLRSTSHTCWVVVFLLLFFGRHVIIHPYECDITWVYYYYYVHTIRYTR
jgi:hypothetical protein